MASRLSLLAVGDMVAMADYPLSRASLVRYAGASGDFNPIHYRDDVAQSVGLPGVLAHGMLTMGVAVAPVVEWCAEDLMVLSYQVRFTKPVVVDPHEGASLHVEAVVATLEAESENPSARIDLTVTSQTGDKVLGKAQIVVAPR